ncbi:Filaggrin [Manis pentadactyla]|nr:Filaggrin [Manis pentadactyla]
MLSSSGSRIWNAASLSSPGGLPWPMREQMSVCACVQTRVHVQLDSSPESGLVSSCGRGLPVDSWVLLSVVGMQQVPSAWGLAGPLVAGRRLGHHSSDVISSRWCLTQRGERPGGSLVSPSYTSFSGPWCPPLAYGPPVGSPPTVYFSSYRQSPVHRSVQPHREAPLCGGFSSASSKGLGKSRTDHAVGTPEVELWLDRHAPSAHQAPEHV